MRGIASSIKNVSDYPIPFIKNKLYNHLNVEFRQNMSIYSNNSIRGVTVGFPAPNPLAPSPLLPSHEVEGGGRPIWKGGRGKKQNVKSFFLDIVSNLNI